MKVLLDTHVLVWAVSRPERLSHDTRAMLRDRANQVLFSAVSTWEVAIKFRLGRPDFPFRPTTLVAYAAEAEFTELPVTSSAAARVAELPLHHRDPFDRLLIAQAADEGTVLLTADTALSAYALHVMMLA